MKKRISILLMATLILTGTMPPSVISAEVISAGIISDGQDDETDIAKDPEAVDVIAPTDPLITPGSVEETPDDTISSEETDTGLTEEDIDVLEDVHVIELSSDSLNVGPTEDISAEEPVFGEDHDIYGEMQEDAEYSGYHDLPEEEPINDFDVNNIGSGSKSGMRRSLSTTLPAKYINDNIPNLKKQINETCWAYSSMALSEINLIKQKYENKDVDLSELQLAYFTYNSATDPLMGTTGDHNGFPDGRNILENGGNLIFTSNVLASWTGAVSESEVPTSGASKDCVLDEEYAYLHDSAHLTDYYKTNASLLSADDVNYVSSDIINMRLSAVKKMIYENGAAGISYRHNSAKYDYDHNSFYTGGKRLGTNHAVTVVGWDDDFDKTNFKTEAPGNGAWLIRNSHMSGEGMEGNMKYEGYFWLSYYDVSISKTAYSFRFEPSVNYDNNYQYDGAMYDVGINATKGADIYTAHSEGGDNGELLRAVAFATGDENVSYTIDIYTDLNDPSDPESGEKACTVTGTTTFPGYHSVNLGRKIPIDEGEMFSTIVTLEGGTLRRESSGSSSWYTITASATEGQSFVASKSEWLDFGASRNSNLRIKAFTDNDTYPLVSFDLNGGSMDKLTSSTYRTGICEDNPSVKDVMSAYGIDINWNTDFPSRQGYEFAGWYDAKDGGSLYDFDSPVTEDLTLYAQWKLPVPSASIQNNDQIYESTGPILYEDAVILLHSSLSGVDILYTLDGSDPSLSGNAGVKSYTGGIRVSDTADQDRTDIDIDHYSITIRACLVSSGYHIGDTVSFTYNILKDDSDWGDISKCEDDMALYTTAGEIPEGFWISGIEDAYTYTGTAIKPQIRVYSGKKLLTSGIDYKVTYTNNKNAYTLSGSAINKNKAPRVKVVLRGNYYGTMNEYFVINRAVIGTDGVNADELMVQELLLAYNGKVQKTLPKVKYSFGESVGNLIQGTDYAVSYPDPLPKMPGEYRISLTGKGNYTGTATVKVKITDIRLISKASADKIKNQEYAHGVQITPLPVLKYKGIVIKGVEKAAYEAMSDAGKADYGYVYSYPASGNTDIGTGYVYIEGVGEFTGKRTITFGITGKNLKKARIDGFINSFVYTGEPVIQGPAFMLCYQKGISLNGIERSEYDELDPGSEEARQYDYTYEYSDNVNVSNKALVTFRGINGNYGTVKKRFKIKAYDIKNDTYLRISIEDPGRSIYLKGGVKPKVTVSDSNLGCILVQGRDYTLKYTNNKIVNVRDAEGKWTLKRIPAITVTGKGNYKGKRSVNFEIGPSVQSDADHTVSITANDKIWRDKAGNYTTTVTLKDADGKKLKAGTDYVKAYRYLDDSGRWLESKDRLQAGSRVRVYVTLKGKYSGQLSVSYRLVKASVGSAKATVNTQVYTGKAVCPGKDQMRISINGVTLKNEDYSIVSYSNNINTGYGLVTICGIGNYGGVKSLSFKIKAKKL